MPAPAPSPSEPSLSTAPSPTPASALRLAACAGAMALVLLFYALFVIRDFSGPIGDDNESFLHEYLSYYASRHLTFWPLPHLQLDSNDILYPFGTNGALQSWCVERDILMTVALRTLGRGPFLQLYYLGGIAVAMLLVFLLLRRDHGDARAAAAASLMHVFNFYSMQKYPYHYNIGVLHWTTVGIVCDFVIVGRAVAGRHVSLRLLAFRALILALAFGLELGHVLGYSLTSAAVSFGYLGWREWQRRRAGQGTPWSALIAARRVEAAAHWKSLTAMGAAIVGVGWLYGGVVSGIVHDARAFDFSRFGAGGAWWSNPVRLLIPYFPFLHPSQQPRFLHVLGDVAENGVGSGGAGWFLLAIAAAGLWQARRNLGPYRPLLIAFLLYVFGSPYTPILRLLPWFAFMRVYSRATLVYSVILPLFAIGVTREVIAPRWRRAAVTGLLLVGAVELGTIALIKQGSRAYSFSSEQYAYLDTIKSTPGEAVFDFPFCLTGGNGDIAGLCPFWNHNKGVYALQRFHEKKVVGQYLGRLHPSQAKPFVDAGWPTLNDPDDPYIDFADHQLRCYDEQEFRLIEDFYRLNDFAGLQLSVDRLPPGCAEEFYRRFGRPRAEMELAGAGRLVFLPKDAAMRAQQDPARGRQVTIGPRPLRETVELVRSGRAPTVEVTGLAARERGSNGGGDWRWGLGPATEIAFTTVEDRRLHLEARFYNQLAGQEVTLLLDGREVGRWSGMGAGEVVERRLDAPIAAGAHRLVLRYLRYNHKSGDSWYLDDGRNMAVMFYSLRAGTD